MNRYYVVVSRWVGAGTEADPYQVEVARHYSAARCADVVGHPRVPTLPNGVLVGVQCDDATGTALELDARYDGCLLWAWDANGIVARDPDGLLTMTELTALLAALQRIGFTAVERQSAVGISLLGRTRRVLSDEFKTWLLARASAR